MSDTRAPFRLLTTDLGGGALSRAILAGQASDTWMAPVPASSAAWRQRAIDVAARHPGWLEAIAPALGPGAALLRDVEHAGVVITTGQQPGLFGGPMYTLAKAISALAMSQAHERATGVPTRPIFWAATDDADFAEASSISVVGPSGLDALSLTFRDAPDGTPLSLRRMGAEVEALYRRLVASCGSAADPRALAAAAEFGAGRMIGDAYVRGLRMLLEPLGIPVLDAAHPSVGAATRPFLVRALAEAPGVHEAVQQRTSALSAAGYPAPVDVDRALSLVFAWEGDGGTMQKRRLSIDEATRAAGRSVRLSPNVLLRPVMEAWLLPTTTYVAGPGELAYFTQVTAVAAALGEPAPLALPRWSGVVIPGDVDDVLSSHGWNVDVLRAPHAAENAIADAAIPTDVTAMFDRLRATITTDLAVLDGVLPPPAVTGARSDLDRRLRRVERRVRAAVKHREQAAVQRIAHARATLHPRGAPQERMLSFVPFLARYGRALVEAQQEAASAHAARWWPVAP